MTTRIILSMVLSVAFLGACSNDGSTASNVGTTASEVGGSPAENTAAGQRHEMTPEQLGELGAQIEKQKNRAPQILSEHGLDAKSFEAQVRKVTEDPEASKRYAAAYRRAKA